jgi:probable F420-dependent oxidoreductase
MKQVRIGVQVQPQHADYATLRAVWREAEALGVDTVFVWDHFYPLSQPGSMHRPGARLGDADGLHFECMTLLGALAATTERVEFGALVLSNGYRNPNLTADMARTLDQISGGRHILGIGAGWSQRDFETYGFPFGSTGERLRDLDRALPVIERRLAKLNPGPARGKLPVLIGGSGETVTLRIVAEHADIWNSIGTPSEIGRKSRILDEWCGKVGRDPAEIERSVLLAGGEMAAEADAYLAEGITHLICPVGSPDFDLDPVRQLVQWRDARRS